MLRQQVMKYTQTVLQLAIFSKNNCLHKSDWLRLNVKPDRLFVSLAYIYIEGACHNLMTSVINSRSYSSDISKSL